MNWNYNSKKQGAIYTATCLSGYVFIRYYSGSSSFTTSTSKTATCKKTYWPYSEYWQFSDGSSSLGDCQSNVYYFVNLKHAHD